MLVESWLSPKVEKKKREGIGMGLFAKVAIAKGELIDAKAGHIIDGKTLKKHATIIRGAELQIADDLFIAPLIKEEHEPSMMHVNHSCEPNLGIAGNICAVTMRDVAAGEELTLDYAMFATSTTQEFVCVCGNGRCRKKITNDDWKIPSLRNAYNGYFSWYIEQKIQAEK